MSRKKYFFYIIVLSLLIPVIACDKNNKDDDMRNAIVGTWKLQSITIDGTTTDTSAYPDVIQFQSNFIFQAYNTTSKVKNRGGWSYEGDMLNISLYLPAAFYIVNIDSKNLTIKRYDFKPDGSLKSTVQQYQRTNDSEMV